MDVYSTDHDFQEDEPEVCFVLYKVDNARISKEDLATFAEDQQHDILPSVYDLKDDEKLDRYTYRYEYLVVKTVGGQQRGTGIRFSVDEIERMDRRAMEDYTF